MTEENRAAKSEVRRVFITSSYIFKLFPIPPPPTLSSSPYIENLRFGFLTIRHLGLSILFFPYSGYVPIAPY